LTGCPTTPPSATVVIATRNRCASLKRTLGKLQSLPESPEIIVADNGSEDGTPGMVQSLFPSARLITLDQNMGGAARTVGVAEASAEAVAFCDDDSYWLPGSLQCASRVMDEHPHIGVVAGRVLIGDAGRIDPTCLEMERSPLPPIAGLAFPRVLGFIACGAVVRRDAYLQAGGFHARFGIGGEEELLSLDLAARGWDLAYVPDVVARHFPSPVRDVTRRREIVTRNALWVSWLRDAAPDCVSSTARLVARAARDKAVRNGIKTAALGLPWITRERCPLPRHVQSARRLLQVDSRRASQ
jgi:GT2 family glycosyltransferase